MAVVVRVFGHTYPPSVLGGSDSYRLLICPVVSTSYFFSLDG